MRYTYTAAWAVVGGGTLQEESQLTELASSESTQFILTRDPDALLVKVDEASALGRLMLTGPWHPRSDYYRTELASEIEEIKAERKKKIAAQTVLVFQAHGEIDASIKEPREYDTFVATFDAVEKNVVRERHRTDIEAMKVAVAFESHVPSRFAHLTDGIYLLNHSSGKPVYSVSVSLNAEFNLSTPISAEAAKWIRDLYTALNQANDIDSVYRLFSQMAEYGTNRLKAFLLGWAALEILIAKSFKSYEQAFFPIGSLPKH